MKLSNYFYLLLAAIAFQSCQSEDPTLSGEFAFQITGIKQSVSYEFTSKSGRTVSEVPDEVYNLTVLIFNSSNELVHERRYYAYGDDQDIPDTLKIPNLPAGDYKVAAITADFYDYYYHEGDSANGEDIGYDLKLPEWTTSESPIYVGYESFKLDSENEIIHINMSNISARVEFRIPEDQNMNGRELGLDMNSINPYSYDIVNGEFISHGQETYFWTSLNEWEEARSRVIYVLPQTLKRLNLNYWDYEGFNFNQEVIFSEQIQLQVGDAISFTIDVEALVAGGGNGVFNFEDIEWNDLGGLNIP